MAVVRPPLVSGVDRHFVHDQAVAATLWTVIHNLGKHPAVSVADTTGKLVFGQIDYTGLDSLTLTFSSPFSGTAYLN